MRIVLILAMLIIGVAFFSFIAAMILYELERHDLKDVRKTDEEYNSQMISKCLEAQQSGKCKHNCKRCSWNTRMKNGVIEFRRKP